MISSSQQDVNIRSFLGNASLQGHAGLLLLDGRGAAVPQDVQGHDHGRWILLRLQRLLP